MRFPTALLSGAFLLAALAFAAVHSGVATGAAVHTAVSPPGISVNDVSVLEGHSGKTKSARFTVSLSASSTVTVKVDYTTVAGDAESDVDFLAAAGTVVFEPGRTSRDLSIQILGDTIIEDRERFSVILSNAANATITDAEGVGTILNDDIPGVPFISVSDASVVEGDTGTTDVVFTISLSSAGAETVTLFYATRQSGAEAGRDYETASSTLTISPGQTAKTITVRVFGDTLDENDETFSVILSAVMNAELLDIEGLGTIIDDDPHSRISISDAAVTEGNDGTVNAVFTVTLTPASGRWVSVDYAVADGTARLGPDVVATSSDFQVVFPPAVTSQTVTVPVVGDTAVEADETFLVNLSNVFNAAIDDGQAVGTIIDDDALALVTGSVSSQGGAWTAIAASVTLTLQGGDVSMTASVSEDDAFELPDVPAGTYTVTAAAPGFLPRENQNVIVTAPSKTLPPVELRAGLVNEDSTVNILDISAVAGAFLQILHDRVDGQGRVVDLNGDGIVNIMDVSLAASNFGATGPQPWE